MNIDDRIKVVRQRTESLGIVWTDDCENLVRRIINNRESRAIIEARSEHCKEFMTTQKHIKDIIGLDPIATKAFAEVFTPKKLVDEMLDKLPKEVWSDDTIKWCDPAVGTGIFLWHGIIPRLMVGLAYKYPNEVDRKNQIAKMLYGVDIQILNVGLCRTYLVKMLGKDNLSIIKMNIVCADSLEFDYWNCKNFKIIGNPPYQKMDGGGQASAKPLYNKFIEKSLEVSNSILFVMPSRWMYGGKGLDTFREEMFNRRDIVSITQYNSTQTSNFFPDAEIKGGVCVIHIDNKKDDEFTLVDGEKCVLSKYDIFVPNKYHSIVDKVMLLPSISNHYIGRAFGIETNDKRLTLEKSSNSIKCKISKVKGKNDSYRWVDVSILKCRESINSWKVCLPRAYGEGDDFIPEKEIFILDSQTVHNGSYVSLAFDTQNDADTVKNTLSSPLAHTLIKLRKKTQDISKDILMWIPNVDWKTIPFTDEELTIIKGSV